MRVRGRVLGGSPGSVGERRGGGGGGSQSGEQVNGRLPSGPGLGAGAARGRRRAPRRPGRGRGARPGFRFAPAPASPRRSPGPGVGGVTRLGLKRNRTNPAASADRYFLCRLVSAPERSRIECFRKSTDKYTRLLCHRSSHRTQT